jgi:hypothetical protein
VKKVVWKYMLAQTHEQVLELPANAHILTVQTQRKQPCLWALVDATLPLERRKIVIVGTGNEDDVLAGLLNYIGTFQTNDGAYIWHVFEDVNAAELASADAFVATEERTQATQEELLLVGI